MLSLNNRVCISKKKKRVGRGGDRGGTSGKGHKGQNARSGGGVGPLFEGGQMSLARRLPKRGFNNKRFAQEWAIVNLNRLNSFDEGAEVTRESLLEKKIVKCGKQACIKILGNGVIEKKLIVYADACSTSAREAIEKYGGEVRVNKEM